jgi:hypothetical protein
VVEVVQCARRGRLVNDRAYGRRIEQLGNSGDGDGDRGMAQLGNGGDGVGDRAQRAGDAHQPGVRAAVGMRCGSGAHRGPYGFIGPEFLRYCRARLRFLRSRKHHQRSETMAAVGVWLGAVHSHGAPIP